MLELCHPNAAVGFCRVACEWLRLDRPDVRVPELSSLKALYEHLQLAEKTPGFSGIQHIRGVPCTSHA
jgi:hypothetical protein